MGERYSQLSRDERNVIHRGRAEGKSFGAIARELNRPVSAVSREVARNTEGGSYDAIRAGEARRRRRRRGTRKLAWGTALWHTVVRKLYRGWSPEQIAGRLRKMHADDASQRVSHETIYLALYALPRGGLRKELLAQLRQGHKSRRPRKRGQDRRGGLSGMTSIHARPEEVQDRQAPGHWEGDLIKGAGNRSAVGTLVERKSRYVVLARMRGTDAEAALDAFTRHFRRIPACVRKTLTYDQGKEMARHEELAQRVRIGVYFADPHSPWQRPSNENANGLIRQYLPKGADLSAVSQATLNAIAKRLNDRPRKCLNYETPAEVFQREILQFKNRVALQT
jgi:transposase, IS30 family